MAKLYSRLGQLVRFLKTKQEEDQYGDPPEFDDVIEFDSETNVDAVNGIDTDWNSHTVVSGILNYKGIPVVINPSGETWREDENEEDARLSWNTLPNWSTWTPDEAELYVRNEVFNGINQDGLDSWIDGNITGTTVTQLRGQTIAALKVIGGNILTLRTILGVVAKVMMYIFRIAIKRL